MLFAHVRKRSNSGSQMFFKTVVLKSFAIFTGKNLWHSNTCFSVNIAKLLRTGPLSKTCSLYLSEFFLMKDY